MPTLLCSAALPQALMQKGQMIMDQNLKQSAKSNLFLNKLIFFRYLLQQGDSISGICDSDYICTETLAFPAIELKTTTAWFETLASWMEDLLALRL